MHCKMRTHLAADSGQHRSIDGPGQLSHGIPQANHHDPSPVLNTPRLIKKYANRRLYDTVDSKHVTLNDIRKLIIGGNDIQVIDDTSGDDITRALLLQIIVEQEQSGQPILTELLLAQLIRFYGNPMQGMMADYLQKSVDTFVSQQRTIQSQMQNMMSNTPVETMRDLMTQNMKAWESFFQRIARRQDDRRQARRRQVRFHTP